MNNLTDLREQLQEDVIAHFKLVEPRLDVHEVCQIIVDRVTELQDKWDTPQELYPKEK
tara:strand:- start:849 stop:1022 length:174 start_codon:yes stop_codon:yes gene_type:complete